MTLLPSLAVLIRHPLVCLARFDGESSSLVAWSDLFCPVTCSLEIRKDCKDQLTSSPSRVMVEICG
ncbi:MAG: hypothetical protein CL860_04665 [Cyanobium sp. MED195]|nr:hypothetical protein [Cyanobium sp. MED195]